MDWVLQVHSLRRALTQSLPLESYGCPLHDWCLDDRPFSGARIPFFPGLLLDGLDFVSDAHAAANSVCYGNPFEECPHEGEGEAGKLSDFRIPDDTGVTGRSYSVTGTAPSRVLTPTDAKERHAQAAAAGIPEHLCTA